MEAREFSAGEEAMEDMAHFVEESDNVVVAHECRFVRCWLSKVGDHCGCWVVSFSRSLVISWENRPYRCMGVFRGCKGIRKFKPDGREVGEQEGIRTTGEEIEVAVPYESRFALSVFLPNSELLNICFTTSILLNFIYERIGTHQDAKWTSRFQ